MYQDKLEASGNIDTLQIDRYVKAIADAMFDASEISPLERRVDSELERRVHRILYRYEERPQETPDIEQRLMEIQDADLGVAILQKAYLVRSETTEESIVKQLIRLANSADRRTKERTLQALKEAANSQIPSLQNLGCKALFQSGQLTAAELLAFVKRSSLDFGYRLEAATTLVNSQSQRAVEAYHAILFAWIEADQKTRALYENELYQLSRAFQIFEGQSEKEATNVVESLYAILENDLQGLYDKKIANKGKKFVQAALAKLPEPTLTFMGALPPSQRSFGAIFTVGTIAKNSPVATEMLMTWLIELLNGKTHFNENLSNQILIQLNRADCSGMFFEVKVAEALEALEKGNVPDVMRSKIQESLEGLGGYHLQGLHQDLLQTLREMAKEYERWPQLEGSDALALRFGFEHNHRRVKAAQLSETERAVLAEALKGTYEQYPWYSSAGWWQESYSHFIGEERMVVLAALGEIAMRESPGSKRVETKTFKRLRQFFQDVAQNGSTAESQKARQLLNEIEPPPDISVIQRIE